MRMVFLILFFMGRGKLNNTFLGHAHNGREPLFYTA